MQTPSTKPLLVFGSRHGSLFNLTPANIPKLLTGVQLSIGDFYDAKCTLQHLPEGMTIKKFLGYPENVKTYLSPYDFYKKECVAGCQDTKKVKIKCAKGFTPFSAADYD